MSNEQCDVLTCAVRARTFRDATRDRGSRLGHWREGAAMTYEL